MNVCQMKIAIYLNIEKCASCIFLFLFFLKLELLSVLIKERVCVCLRWLVKSTARIRLSFFGRTAEGPDVPDI